MKDILEKVFSNYKPHINDEDNMKLCAVIVPIIKVNDVYNIVFEIRNDNLNANPGEICFPGGRLESGESPKDAALRECYEEIGISNDNIEIISPLDIFVSHNNIIIYPFLGYIRDETEFNINKDEVKELLMIPIEYLLNYNPISVTNKVVTIANEKFPYEYIRNGADYKFRDGSYRVVFYKYRNHNIWGMTAKILENFLKVIKASNEFKKV